MNVQELIEYKKIYKSIKVDDAFLENGWQNLSQRLPERRIKAYSEKTFIFAGAFAVLALVLLLAIFGFSFNSKSTSTFSALKSASKDFSDKVLNLLEIHNVRPTQTLQKLNTVSPTPIISITISPTVGLDKHENTIENKDTGTPQNNNNNSQSKNQDNQNQVKGVSTQNTNPGNSVENKNNSESDGSKGNSNGNNGNENSNGKSDNTKNNSSKH